MNLKLDKYMKILNKNNNPYTRIVELISKSTGEFPYFPGKRVDLYIVLGLLPLCLVIALKPVAFGVLLGGLILVALLLLYPESGLLLFITLIPLHIVIVKVVGIFPGIWKECLLVLTVMAWFIHGLVSKKLCMVRTKINTPLCLFIFWNTSLLLIDINNFNYNIIGLRNLLQYSLVFILAVNLIKNKSGIKKYIFPIIIICVIPAIVNMYLFLFMSKIVDATGARLFILGEMKRMAPVAFMGAENYAYYLSMISSLLIGFLIFAKSKKVKVVLVLGVLAAVSAMLLTGTRGGMVALFTAIAFFGIRYSKKALFAFIVLFFIILLFLPTELRGRLTTGFFKNRANERVLMVQNALVAACDSPIWGIGLGNVGAAFPGDSRLATPHNYYCYLALQTGFVGLAIFLWILAIFLITSLRVHERVKGNYWKGLTAGLIMLLVAFSASAMFAGSGESFIIAPFFWFFGGVVMVLDNEARKNEACLP